MFACRYCGEITQNTLLLCLIHFILEKFKHHLGKKKIQKSCPIIKLEIQRGDTLKLMIIFLTVCMPSLKLCYSNIVKKKNSHYRDNSHYNQCKYASLAILANFELQFLELPRIATSPWWRGLLVLGKLVLGEGPDNARCEDFYDSE